MVVLRRCKGNHHFGFSKRKTDGNGKFLALFSIYPYLKIINIMLNSTFWSMPHLDTKHFSFEHDNDNKINQFLTHPLLQIPKGMT